MGILGTTGVATFGSLFAMSLTTQFALPYLGYFVLAALVLFFIGGTILAVRNINWSKDEKKAVNDLAKGERSPEAMKLLAAVNNPVKAGKKKISPVNRP